MTISNQHFSKGLQAGAFSSSSIQKVTDGSLRSDLCLDSRVAEAFDSFSQ